MRLQLGSRACLLVLVLAVELVVGVDFTQCLNDLKANANASQDLTGLLDSSGYPVSNVADAAAISYSLCISACGTGQEPFQWPVFSQDFTSWLLPNLALISQLPFGAQHRPDNLMSAVLTIGSPVLAGYSLFITLLNSRWINRRFNSVDYPNSRFAVSILSSLQQVPLRIHHDFPSLVVLPENDIWWKYLSELLDYTHTWSIASVASIAWVVIAYILTVVNSPPDSFGVTTDGEDTASMWLWLIPIVVGWLQLSPKCDFKRLQKAYGRADRHTRRAAADSHNTGTPPTSTPRALTITATEKDVKSPDELITAPVFNYSRSLRWASTAESIFLVFEAASEKAKKHFTVQGGEWVKSEVDEFDTTINTIHPDNRRGTPEQIASYCVQPDNTRHSHLAPPDDAQRSHWVWPEDAQRSHWEPEVIKRMAIASCTSLALQWGTVGASAIVAYFTPTTRIGCRSLSYLLYAATSTVIWMMLVLSSVLVHYSATPSLQESDLSARVALALSHWLRRVAKLLAIANSLWVILMCALQYSQFYDTCYCNAGVISRGKAAYAVIIQSAAQIKVAKTAWIASLVLACSSATFFFGFFNLLSDTQS